MLSIVQSIADLLQQALHAQQHPPPRGNDQEIKAIAVLHELIHHKPPSFKGDPDLEVAEQWWDYIIKVSDALSIIEDRSKITLATYVSLLEKLHNGGE